MFLDKMESIQKVFDKRSFSSVNTYRSVYNTLYIEGIYHDRKYVVSYNTNYIFTVDNLYVCVSNDPKDIIDSIEAIISPKRKDYAVSELTKHVAMLSGNTTY